MRTLSVLFLKDEMPEIKQIISIMKECQILSEQDIPGSELVTVVMMVSDPSDLYSIGLLVGIDRAKNVSTKIFKNLNEKASIKNIKP